MLNSVLKYGVPVLAIGVLIFVHELGHFLVARWSGVRVLCFSLGFGKTLCSWTRGETEYRIAWIPFGGYVRMAGEQRSEQSQAPDEYLAQSVLTRFTIVLAGPLTNYLFAIALLWGVFMLGYPQSLPVIGQLDDEVRVAAEAGFESGDRLVAIDGEPVETWEQITAHIHAAAGRELAIEVEREAGRRTIPVTPQLTDGTDLFGRKQPVGLIGIHARVELVRTAPLEAARRALLATGELTVLTIRGLWYMVSGQIAVRDSAMGPVGLLQLGSEAYGLGLVPLLHLMGVISLALAIFNVLPIPILDGGHLLFLVIERLRGMPVSIRIQERASQVGLVLLLLLFAVITLNDVDRIRQSGAEEPIEQIVPAR